MTNDNEQSPFGEELDQLALRLSDAGLIKHPGALKAAFGLSALGLQISAILERHFAALGLSQTRFSVLLALSQLENVPSTAVALAQMFGVSKPTMTDILKVLERDGWIAISPSKKDKRAKNIAMSVEGRANFQRLLPEHYKRLAKLNGDWDQNFCDQVVELVQQLLGDYHRFGQEIQSLPTLEFAPNKDTKNG